jgi:hypothetical protein
LLQQQQQQTFHVVDFMTFFPLSNKTIYTAKKSLSTFNYKNKIQRIWPSKNFVCVFISLGESMLKQKPGKVREEEEENIEFHFE